uniref:Uncharacterized protein n=1 Tax=Oryza punctata TaxID=4537 RepID=A0A0E0LL19_ORYPU
MATIGDRRRISCEVERRRRQISRRPELVTTATTGRDAARRFATAADRRVVLPPALRRGGVGRIQNNERYRSAAVLARPAPVPSEHATSAGAGDEAIKKRVRVRVSVRNRVGKIMSSISRTIHLTSRDVVKHSGVHVATCHQS